MTRLAAALKSSISAVAIASLLLQGCAAPSGSEGPAYAAAAGDPCTPQRTALKDSEDYFVSGIAMGAVAGGAIGALATGSVIRALAAAAAGAAAGAVGGYYAYKSDNIKDRKQLVSSIHSDVAAEVEQIDSATAAFRTLAQCRFNAAQAVKADFQASRIGRTEAEQRLEQQRTLFAQDVQFAESLGVKMEKRATEYEFASSELLKDDPEARRQLEERRAQQAKLDAEAAARDQAQAAAAAASASTPAPAQTAPASPPPRATTPRPAAPAAASPAPAAPRQQASVQPTQRTRTVPVAVPAPADAAGIGQLTDSNRIKRRAFSDQLVDAKATAEVTFKIDDRITAAPTSARLG